MGPVSSTLVILFSLVKGFMNPRQSSNAGRTVTILGPASKYVATSQTQGVLRSQGLTVTATHIVSTALDVTSGFSVWPSSFSAVESGPMMTTLSSSQSRPGIETEHAKLTLNAEIQLRQRCAYALHYAGCAGELLPTVTQSSQISAALSLTGDSPTSSSSVAIDNQGKMTTQDTQSQDTEPTQPLEMISSTNLRPSTATNGLSLQTPKGEAVITYGISTHSPTAIEVTAGLVFGTQRIAATSKSQNISPFGQSTSSSSTVTVGSGDHSPGPDRQASISETIRMKSQDIHFGGAKITELPALITSSQPITAGDQQNHKPSSTTTVDSSTSTTIPVPYSFSIPNLHIFSSSTSKLFNVNATLNGSKTTSSLTMSTQTMQNNSLGQYSTDGQVLTQGGGVKISGTMVSLAPDKSSLAMETGTKALSGNTTAGPTIASSATGVQTFKGSALGVKDGLRSSLTAMLIGIVVLLWIRRIVFADTI